jgi:putative membrane protein
MKKLSMTSRVMFATIAAAGLCLGAVAQAAEEPAKSDASPSATKSKTEMTSEKMVKDHKKDIAAFEKEAKDGEDADVKAWAEKTLPTLNEHLKMVQDAQSKMK